MRVTRFWSWFWIALGVLYFFLPLYATFQFSLKAQRDTLSFLAYQNVLNDPKFAETFLFSLQMAVWTILVGVVLVVPTVYWVHLRLPAVRPYMELVTLMPFVIPAVVLVFGLIRTYAPLFTWTWMGRAVLVAGYVVLSLPYMYRSVDAGLRAMDVRSLTEAAQSLGASWPTILWRIILPNLRTALLSGAFLTLAIVIGEFTLASLLAQPAFGPYLALMGQNRAYEPAALAIMSFALTWAAMGLIQWLGRGRPGGSQLSGTH
ncbi:MAG: ABC transporter permease subunit [Caldilineaceae bacterium]|nr:ABC transporter permease subunit [Caldilineaceae bacterium]